MSRQIALKFGKLRENIHAGGMSLRLWGSFRYLSWSQTLGLKAGGGRLGLLVLVLLNIGH